MFNYQTDWLSKWAVYTPNKFFLREYNRDLRWTFKQFNERTNALAAHLVTNFNIKIGDRIAVFSKNRAEFVQLFLAAIKCGAILVPLNFRLTARELDLLINDAQPKLFLFEEEYRNEVIKLNSLKRVEQSETINEFTHFLIDDFTDYKFIPEKTFGESDVCMILYTAGTTGLSKGVIINHRMLMWNAINTGLRLDLTSSDHTQSYAPFFHTGGWNVLFTPFLLHGASHTLIQNFDAELILKLMEEEKSTIMFGVPTMLQMMSDLKNFETANLSSLRYAIVGGAPMPIPLINIWHKKNVPIRQGYGLTEVGPNCFSLHQDDAIRKKGSIGFPNFYIEAKIIDDNGNECKLNEVGELLLRSPVVTDGYWGKAEETKKSITDGFFHTGDLVRKDEENYFYVVDRKKNMFISGGENVYPAEIEKFLYTHNSIKEVAVIGVPDSKWGEVGKAFVVIKNNEQLSREEIINFCVGNLAKYKIPKYVEILDNIPKTDAGKINKLKLLELHNQHK
ncbi:MAG: AMP-dependent synthetase [Chlorobiaceae bacterium]|nr:AMP-dependent synthetase [Chlorobiaceae bacterium]MBA4309012.1 AMP-dependent synthetase [Chlorobiaceae bacterium]